MSANIRSAWTRVAAAVALLSTPWVGFAQELDWSRHDVRNHPVSVEVPGEAKDEVQTTSWGLFGTAETHSVESDTEGAELSALATSAPPWAVKGAGHDLIFMTTRDTILRRRQGKAMSWEPIERAGLSGRRLMYVIAGDVERRGTMEVFVKDSTILTFDAVVPSVADVSFVERFFSSIRMYE